MVPFFEVDYHSGYAVIRIQRKFNISSIREFRVQWGEILARGIYRVILDMQNVTQMDSSGIGAIVMLRNVLEQNKGKLVLVNGPNNICNLFEITGMKNLLCYVTDMDEAVKLVSE
jgi:anti-anti-sigma factor